MPWSRSLEETNNVLNDAIAIGQRRVRDVSDQSRTSIILALGIVAILSILITYMLRSSIANPLDAFMEFVERVGRGDLAGQTAAAGNGRVGPPRHDAERHGRWASTIGECRAAKRRKT